ncbi:hypothetical protein [Paenibacillus chitinolyticus]
MQKYALNAEWTDDCQGKKDYDGNIVSISTRYWPESDFTPIGGKFVKPHAKSELFLRFGEHDDLTLDLKEFEGETFEEVKTQVEEWAQEKMDEIVQLLKSRYKVD